MDSPLKYYANRIESSHVDSFRSRKAEFVRLVTACPGFSDYQQVQRLLKDLPDAISRQTLNRDSLNDQLSEIYQTCLEYRDENQRLGLTDLFEGLDTLLKRRADERPVRELDWWLREQTGSATLRRQDAKKLLADLERSDGINLIRIYHAARPNAPELGDDRHDSRAMLYHLSHCDANVVQSFLALFKQAIIAPPAVAGCSPESPPPQAFLMVRIVPAEDNPEEFDATFSVATEDQRGDGPWEHRNLDRKRVAAVLSETLEHELLEDAEVTVELILPPELLCRDWDRLPTARGEIGHHYRVVCRLEGRLRSSTKDWKRRWSAYHEAEPKRFVVDSTTQDRWLWVDTDRAAPIPCPELAHGAVAKRLLQLPDCGLAAFDLLPLGSTLCDYARSAMNAGLPILLGRRNDSSHRDPLRAEVTQMLTDGHKELPTTVKSRRIDAMDNPDHWGNHILLVWDDPTRQPKMIGS